MESAPQVIHPQGGQDKTAQHHDAPSGSTAPLVDQILALWGELLNRPGIGADDEFFALGGNSLTGIKIIERVALDHGVQLSVRDFYLAQTPARVAGLIEQGRSGT
ncbi:phosphopantetheine-binding protein [Umezawaea tangerina]|uniref:Phosphopantetheine binding protein n=1 Tax=Umezawaea tangerina TaxID=84725 RepID=A0A2T0T7P0_9PSEU|nr:phosphopantetheine-binding protein [Umezawaea tangerina]PRY41661.1 phosphopantetheine binding protein [Umezawaea tangerina]